MTLHLVQSENPWAAWENSAPMILWNFFVGGFSLLVLFKLLFGVSKTIDRYMSKGTPMSTGRSLKTVFIHASNYRH